MANAEQVTAPETEVAESTAAPELSDDEALAVAVETYEEYLAISGELIDTQGENFDALEAITTSNMGEANSEALEQAQSGIFSTEGQIPVTKSELVENKTSQIDVLLCIDLSQSATLDQNGEQVGPDRTGLMDAIYVRVASIGGVYKIDRSDSWTQSEFC